MQRGMGKLGHAHTDMSADCITEKQKATSAKAEGKTAGRILPSFSTSRCAGVASASTSASTQVTVTVGEIFFFAVSDMGGMTENSLRG